MDRTLLLMTRYKGRLSAKAIEREFPHHVDMVVPRGGFGNRLDAMHDFHTLYGIKFQRGQGRREGEWDIIRWCFSDRAIAQEFALEFGGALVQRASTSEG